ncbi:MAG: alpha/beta hydrolase [Oscillospiraceae bacterium]|nr:alpha/beta hydrolase [Oscillospiraceae bacterium]
MAYKKFCGRFMSADGIHEIAYYKYIPDGKIKGIVQLLHGMCEYAERYEPFISFLCENGYAVYAHDHLGHGRTASGLDELGYFGEENGWLFLINDTVSLRCMIADEYGRLPCVIYGHSMGSLVARAVICKRPELYCGAVIEGTVGFFYQLIDIGIITADIQRFFKGGAYHSAFLQRLLDRLGCMRIPDRKSGFDWLSRRKEVVTDFIADDYKNFNFTCAGFHDLFMLICCVSSKKWFIHADKKLPVLILGGTEDPVAAYGNGSVQLYEKMCRTGFENIRLRLYDGARHEMLNDLNGTQVMEDTLNWINERIDRKCIQR